ncbi:MAG: glycosyltransferase family 9 protein [Solirubrobacterales bacterium]|nr:glycosyltransferase family 9 protein [Solirubrobacterales bacterium]MBV9716651.1 glycosyltransferase family 9 protein [Solirubrobacterales bacterium]
MTSPRWAEARKLLCVRLDTIGDVLMSGPAVRALAAGRRVTLLTSPVGALAAELMPEIDETIVYRAPWMKAAPASAGADLELVERLRERRFDGAVIFTVYSQSPLPAALVCRLAGIPLSLAHCRENPYALLSDWVREPEPERVVRHEVRRQLDLVAAIGARVADERLRIAIPAPARERVGRILAEHGLGDARNWILVHPGASASSRRYPATLLAEACRALVREHGVRLVFSGEAADHALVEEIRAGVEEVRAGVEEARAGADEVRAGGASPALSLAGALGLAELAALVAAAPVLVAGNTGPVHLAAATGTPVVDLYALTNPQHTPWQVPSVVLYHDVPCRWCYRSVCPEGHHRCLAGVAPERVVAAALRLLRGGEAERWTEAVALG